MKNKTEKRYFSQTLQVIDSRHRSTVLTGTSQASVVFLSCVLCLFNSSTSTGAGVLPWSLSFEKMFYSKEVFFQFFF